MRILHFWDGRRGTPRRLQIDFVKKLANHCEFYVYGKNEDAHNGKEMSPIVYQTSRNIQEIVDELKADILLIPEWAIGRNVIGLKDCKIPIVMMEVDWYATDQCDQDFYKNNNIEHIITRAPVSFEDQGIKSVWLPLSVNNKEFYTNPNTNYLHGRKNKVTFVGAGPGSRNKFYIDRIKAINKLNNSEHFESVGIRYPSIYASTLKEYIGALSCSFSELKMAPAKVWEIMACGCALLVSDFYYRKRLFGEEECMFIYKNDLSDIDDKVNEIVSDLDKVKAYTKTALNVIQNRHLDSHRILELYNILKAINEGKEIPKIWGL